eukprot:scaffold89524_cov72-Phaeocystis_antarctica.AAC.2
MRLVQEEGDGVGTPTLARPHQGGAPVFVRSIDVRSLFSQQPPHGCEMPAARRPLQRRVAVLVDGVRCGPALGRKAPCGVKVARRARAQPADGAKGLRGVTAVSLDDVNTHGGGGLLRPLPGGGWLGGGRRARDG